MKCRLHLFQPVTLHLRLHHHFEVVAPFLPLPPMYCHLTRHDAATRRRSFIHAEMSIPAGIMRRKSFTLTAYQGRTSFNTTICCRFFGDVYRSSASCYYLVTSFLATVDAILNFITRHDSSGDTAFTRYIHHDTNGLLAYHVSIYAIAISSAPRQRPSVSARSAVGRHTQQLA